MKAHIEIPDGWRRVTRGECRTGDLTLQTWRTEDLWVKAPRWLIGFEISLYEVLVIRRKETGDDHA